MARLEQATKPRIIPPPRLIIYGEEKIGKSTFASEAPSPVFMDIEDGLNYIPKVNSVPIPEFFDLIYTLEELLTINHEYKTVAIDSVGWLCDIIKQHVCQIGSVEKIGDIPYGGGYQLIDDAILDLLKILDRLRIEKRMCIIMIGHSVTRAVNNDPIDDAHDKHEIEGEKRLIRKIERWADCILFAKNKVISTESKKGNKVDVKTFDTGRVLYCNKNAAYAGGSRMDLPDEVPFELGSSWKTFYDNYKEAMRKLNEQ